MTLPIKFPIKFRGKEFQTGNYVYGIDITHGGVRESGEKVVWIGDDENGFHVVDEKTITLFVGYDKNGKELYAGDPVADQYGEGWASLVARVGIKCKPVGETFDDHWVNVLRPKEVGASCFKDRCAEGYVLHNLHRRKFPSNRRYFRLAFYQLL